ncbi:MAG TPA: ABC transporter ATP-binding protein [Candidatus Fimimorpha excrementavium]|nr:ABC transporter ATP-binding protein [Candidatus Fimimorpha excrementavium]
MKKDKKNRVLAYMAKWWYLYLIGFAAMFLAIYLDMKGPQVTQSIIDDVIVDGQVWILMRLLLMLLGIGFGRAICGYVKEFIFDCAGVRVGRDLRKMLFGHIQGLGVDYFDRTNTGELMARVKDDVDRIWSVTGFIGMLIVESIVHTIAVLYCMFHISPALMLVPLVTMPLVGWTAVRLENKLDRVYQDISEQNAELNTVAQENLAGVRTVKSFAREDYEIEKFRRQNGKYYELNMKLASVLAKYEPNISFYTKIMLVCVIIVGGIMVIRGQITIGQLGAFTEYANNIIWPMECLGWLSNELAAAFASYKKVDAIMEEEARIKDPEHPVQVDGVRGEIAFDHVDLEIDGHKILRDISFHVDAGKTLGIMGMTGSGKSSVINLLERFYDAAAGRVMIDGRDVRTMRLEDIRKNIAVVMQDVFLFSDTIQENISVGQRDVLEYETVCQAAGAASAHDFIQRLSDQYDTVIGERGVGLSGGQKQRISIARALAKKTPILILDDSTSALDMETEYQIQTELGKLEDVTKLIIAHRISAVRHADEIIILKDGQIAERGTHERLMEKKGMYYETYLAQYDTQWEPVPGTEEQKGGEKPWQ